MVISGSTIVQDLLECQKYQKLSDLVFRIEGYLLYVHRFFVLNKFPIVKQMIETTQERDENNRPIVTLTSPYLNLPVFRALVQFAYVSYFSMEQDLDLKMLENFAVKELQLQDEEFLALCKRIRVDNPSLPKFLSSIFNNPNSFPDVRFRLPDGNIFYAHKVNFTFLRRVLISF